MWEPWFTANEVKYAIRENSDLCVDDFVDGIGLREKEIGFVGQRKNEYRRDGVSTGDSSVRSGGKQHD
jgi:hypothetical protein